MTINQQVINYVDIAVFDELKTVHVQVYNVADLDYVWTIELLLSTLDKVKKGSNWTIQVRNSAKG